MEREEEWQTAVLCSHGNRPGREGTLSPDCLQLCQGEGKEALAHILPGGWIPKRRGSPLQGNTETNPAANTVQTPPAQAAVHFSHIVHTFSWHLRTRKPSPGTRRNRCPGFHLLHMLGLGTLPEESVGNRCKNFQETSGAAAQGGGNSTGHRQQQSWASPPPSATQWPQVNQLPPDALSEQWFTGRASEEPPHQPNEAGVSPILVK